jgi:NTP pyrophosphatase (non-canonical NTP hydrolase)
VILADLGYQVGGAKRPTEAELRASYQQSGLGAPKWTLRLVRVPDAPTAQTVQAQLQQDPSSFPWDPPGARLLDAVAVMDRLRSPGGCPWDAEQTHATLAPYLLEEAYELLDAIESDDLQLLREELGDVLLQVVLHARLAEDAPVGERWSVDDVAGDLVAELIRRHPHVFADHPGQRGGIDPEHALRSVTRDFRDAMLAAEGQASGGGSVD